MDESMCRPIAKTEEDFLFFSRPSLTTSPAILVFVQEDPIAGLGAQNLLGVYTGTSVAYLVKKKPYKTPESTLPFLSLHHGYQVTITILELPSWKGPYGSSSPATVKEAKRGIKLPT